MVLGIIDCAAFEAFMGHCTTSVSGFHISSSRSSLLFLKYSSFDLLVNIYDYTPLLLTSIRLKELVLHFSSYSIQVCNHGRPRKYSLGLQNRIYSEPCNTTSTASLKSTSEIGIHQRTMHLPITIPTIPPRLLSQISHRSAFTSASLSTKSNHPSLRRRNTSKSPTFLFKFHHHILINRSITPEVAKGRRLT